jgi:aspartate racemase
MSKHIGIVACSAEGAALCYRTICMEGANLLGRYTHPEIIMHTFPLCEYMRYIEKGDWENVADLMLSSVSKLAKVGADFAICPDNTIHQAFDLVINKSPIPWLHIAQEVAAEAKRKEYKRLGVLGTRYLMEGPVYPSKITAVGIEHMIPEVKYRERINQIIFDELINARFTSEALAYFKGIINELKNKGCDAVILGCTEIPLLVTQEDSSLPILDSTRLLARAALKKAIDRKSTRLNSSH